MKKIAIVHYWFINWSGGEKAARVLLDVYPDADIYTHVYDEQSTEGQLSSFKVQTTFINKLPLARKKYQLYLPLMPIALEQLDLREYDLVISSESGPAKGVITRPDALHVCYYQSSMRYIWDMYPDYLSSVGPIKRTLIRPLAHYLKIYDRLSADRVDYFLANSEFVAKKIEKYYRRRADVVYPPVAVDQCNTARSKADFYLLLGRLVVYKRADLAVDAFLQNGRRLFVVGYGEQYKKLKRKETEKVRILGGADWDGCKDYLARARALIFPGIEDFGMVPVEAMASGTPVLAFAAGGALETIEDGKTGLFFNEQTITSLNDCVERFEEMEDCFDKNYLISRARKFSTEKFKQQIKEFIQDKLDKGNATS